MEIFIRNVLVCIVIVCIILLIYTKRKKEKNSILYNVLIIIFSIFLLIVFSITGISPISGFNIDISLSDISFIPFKGIVEILKEGTRYSFVNIIGNIVLFMPIGFLVPFIYTKINSYKKIIIFGFSISLLVELSQLFLRRATDIDDLILNTLGTLFGYLVFIAFQKTFIKLTKEVIIKSESIQNKVFLLIGIVVPYFVVVICGFYDRFKYLIE